MYSYKSQAVPTKWKRNISVIFGVLLFLGLAASCSTTGDLEEVRGTANNALSRANVAEAEIAGLRAELDELVKAVAEMAEKHLKENEDLRKELEELKKKSGAAFLERQSSVSPPLGSA